MIIIVKLTGLVTLVIGGILAVACLIYRLFTRKKKYLSSKGSDSEK